MRRNVLILDTGKEWGGGTNSLLELLKRIDRKRYAFSALFYNNYRKGEESDIKTELEKLGVEFILLETRKRILPKVVKELARGALALSPGLKKKYIFRHDYGERILPSSRAIAYVLREGGFHLLYMNNQPSSNLEGILAAKETGTPCVQHSRIEVGLNAIEADAVNRRVSRVICVSEGVRKSLVDAGVRPEKCVVVYNGIDPEMRPKKKAQEIRRGLGMKEGVPLIGTVGSLVKRKRVSLLLEAFAHIPGAHCAVVGSGPEEGALKEKARALGIAERVAFTGFSPDPLSFINAMDVFVLPSEKEGLPRVILEAMLLGKPVVAAKVTGPSELVVHGETGFLVEDGDVRSAIEKLLSSEALRKDMGEKGRKRVIEKFSVEDYARGVEGVFEEVLGGLNQPGR